MPTQSPSPRARIVVQVMEVEVLSQTKYLGLILHGRGSFGPHLQQLAPRLDRAAAALGTIFAMLSGETSA